ncbi:hypothetical protein [Methylomarinum vadi]|uniref:hypothetical protein n=1 Tax=Methylomarinum vadi TaxID=438855 RepID=UPI0012697BFF|nr:hypothetical protein [Methylomarinum vadi]
MWRIQLRNPVKFIPISVFPSNIFWHKSVFKGYGEGITDVGGTQKLADLCKLREVDDIHPIVSLNPDYFFQTANTTWVYTGRVGNAPDYLGFNQIECVVGEVKWNDGWHLRLLPQIKEYVSRKIWLSNTNNKIISIYIACPQTASRQLLDNLVKIKSGDWKSVRLFFGFIQFGWLRSNSHDTYMRVLWKPSHEWNGESFNGSDDVGLH